MKLLPLTERGRPAEAAYEDPYTRLFREKLFGNRTDSKPIQKGKIPSPK